MIRNFIILLILCVVCVMPVSAKPISVLSSIISLSDFPNHGALMFEKELRKIFRSIKDVERYDATDLPDDVDDPFYWAIGAVGFAQVGGKEQTFLIGCNRIGRSSAKIASQSSSIQNRTKNRIAGVWPSPMKPFPNDAIARLDCFIAGGAETSSSDLNVLAEQLRKRFSEVQIQNQGKGFYKLPITSLVATGGKAVGHQRVHRIGVVAGSTTDVSFTVWLLRTNG